MTRQEADVDERRHVVSPGAGLPANEHLTKAFDARALAAYLAVRGQSRADIRHYSGSILPWIGIDLNVCRHQFVSASFLGFCPILCPLDRVTLTKKVKIPVKANDILRRNPAG
jgi:hypothetical protein